MRKSIHILFALTLFLGASAFSQAVPGLTDTVKISVVGLDAASGDQNGQFKAEIRISNDTAYAGGTLGFNWDNPRWKLDSVEFGPLLNAWEIKNASVDSAARTTLIGGAKIFAPNFGPGDNLLWATLWFDTTGGSGTWTAGDEVNIDSTFVPPAGGFLVVYTGNRTRAPRFVGGNVVTYNDIAIDGAGLPKSFELSQNYPNPFNPTTKFNYSTPKAVEVSISVFNVLGQKIKTLVNGVRQAGNYEVTWDGDNDQGQKVASGLYFYKIQAGSFVETRKMLLTK